MGQYRLIPVGEPRKCGDCTACCFALGVWEGELNKEPSQECPHCDVGHGCRIYNSRPKVCRDFRCEWLKGFGGYYDRPDKTGVVLDFVTNEYVKPGVVQIWEAKAGALEQAYASEVTRYFVLEESIYVAHMYLSGRRRVFHPRNKTPSRALIAALAGDGAELARL